MILLVVVLLALFVVVLWSYTRSAPTEARKKAVVIYNAWTFFTALALCLLFTSRIHGNMAAGPNRSWWPLLSVAGSLVIFTACLLVARFVRDHVIFGRPRIGRR